MLSCRAWRSSNTRSFESIRLLNSTHPCHCSDSSGPCLLLASCPHFPPLISSLNQYPLATSSVYSQSVVQAGAGIQGVCVSQPAQAHGRLVHCYYPLCYVFGKDALSQPIKPNSPLGLKSLELISLWSCPPGPGLSYSFVDLLFLISR